MVSSLTVNRCSSRKPRLQNQAGLQLQPLPFPHCMILGETISDPLSLSVLPSAMEIIMATPSNNNSHVADGGISWAAKQVLRWYEESSWHIESIQQRLVGSCFTRPPSCTASRKIRFWSHVYNSSGRMPDLGVLLSNRLTSPVVQESSLASVQDKRAPVWVINYTYCRYTNGY